VFQITFVLEENERYCGFQTRRVDRHTADTTAFLQKLFGDCVVKSGLWRPRPQGPAPPDPILCRFPKERVYVNNPRNLKDLKHNTKGAVAGTDQRTFIKVAKDTVKWVNTSVQKGGDHFQHLLSSHMVCDLLNIFEKINTLLYLVAFYTVHPL
jgi:hypothetical protein